MLLFLKRHYGSDSLEDTHSSDLGDTGEGGPATGEERVGGRTSPEQPPAGRGAESLRPPGVLPPRPRLSERSHQGLDVKLESLSGAEGRRGAGAGAGAAFLGTGFSSLDMSLCVVLYVASSLFLMVMYFFFRVRSKRWKVRHHHPSV